MLNDRLDSRVDEMIEVRGEHADKGCLHNLLTFNPSSVVWYERLKNFALSHQPCGQEMLKVGKRATRMIPTTHAASSSLSVS